MALGREIPVPLCFYSPNRNQQYHQEREDHLHVGERVHPECTEDDQLDHLNSCEEVHFPLRHTADVVGGRIGGLDGETIAAYYNCLCDS